MDVSTYQPVVWEERDAEACKTEWRMECEDRAEQICADVSETRCDVSLIPIPMNSRTKHSPLFEGGAIH